MKNGYYFNNFGTLIVYSSPNKSNMLIINSTSKKSIKILNSANIKTVKFLCKCFNHLKLLLDNNLSIETIDLSNKDFYDAKLENLSPMLKNLYLNNEYNKLINNFPQSLTVLECNDDFYFINQTKILSFI